MKLLKQLQHWPTTGSPAAFAAVAPPLERRAAPRHGVDRAVWIRKLGAVPAAGSVINISLSGAAIRIDGSSAWMTESWPVHLRNGDEVWLVGLLGEPVFCWAVAVNDGVLKVHFSLDAERQWQLRETIAALLAPAS